MKKLLSMILALAMILSLAACGQKAEPAPAEDPQPEQQEQPGPAAEPESLPEPEAEPETAPEPEPVADDRGIDGMSAGMIMSLLTTDPFQIPVGELKDAPAEAAEIFAYTTSSTSVGSDGMAYDYALTLDSDKEIMSASFGVSGDDAAKVALAADLLFYAVAINTYDTGDEDALKAWMSDAIAQSRSGEVSTTIGDATFTMHCASNLAYWVDIAKAS